MIGASLLLYTIQLTWISMVIRAVYNNPSSGLCEGAHTSPKETQSHTVFT